MNAQNSIVSPAGTGTVGTMTVSGSMGLSGGTLAYDAGDQIALGGPLSLGGSISVIPTAPLSSGTYTVFTAASVPVDVSSLAVTGLYDSGRQSYLFATSGGTAVTLTVGGSFGFLTWTGGNNNTWDVQSSPSWYNTTSGSADVFYNGDIVTFDDSAGSAAGNVTINGPVQPAALTVSNTAVNYTFGGGPIVGTTNLVKNGPGSLTLASSNAYTGGTALNDGVLNANAAQAIGSGPLVISGGTFNANAAQSPAYVNVFGGVLNANAAMSPAYVNLSAGLLNFGNSAAIGGGPLTISSGSLDNTSGSSMTLAGNNAMNWNGSFTYLGSNPLNTGTGAVTLGSTAVVTVANSTLTVGGVIGGNYGFAVAGPGTLALAASNTYTGGTARSRECSPSSTAASARGPSRWRAARCNTRPATPRTSPAACCSTAARPPSTPTAIT